MKFPIKLIEDLVAITYVPQESKIKMPDWAKILKGQVIAKGPKVSDEVQIGDTVTFGAAKGIEASCHGFSARILREDNLDAVLL